jgi:hypothetical protein
MPESLLERSKAKSILDKSDVSKKGEYLELEPEISSPTSLLERAIVKKKPKGEYVEIPYEGEEKPESLSLVERATVKKEGKGHHWKKDIVHWMLEKPEEHRYLHALAEDIRQKYGITGTTSAARMASLASHIEHGVSAGVKGIIERKKVEMGGILPITEPIRAVPPSEYVRPVEQVIPQEAEMAEMPEAEIPAVSRLGGAVPEKEILICRKLKDVI